MSVSEHPIGEVETCFSITWCGVKSLNQLIFITEYLFSFGHHLLWTIYFYVYFLCTVIHWVCGVCVHCSHCCMFGAIIYLELIFGRFFIFIISFQVAASLILGFCVVQ